MATALRLVSQNNSPIVVIGDFNINLNDVERSLQFKTLMSKYKLRSLLLEGTSTTDFETQIDVIFTNTENCSSGTYETYFSDHKPIFIQICENPISLNNESSFQRVNETNQVTSEFLLKSFDSLSISGDRNLIDINLKLSQEFENLNISQEFKDIKDQNSNDDKNEEDLSFLLDIPDTVALNIEEILTPIVCLASDHINKFGEILNSQFGFQHQDVLFSSPHTRNSESEI